MKSGYTYIMTNKYHNVLYTGCTVDIIKRVTQHKKHYYKGSFSDRYNCEYCVYFEEFPDYNSAIQRENQLKNMTRSEKLTLINNRNPEWKELVTENGFCEKQKTWAEQVKQVMDELLGKSETEQDDLHG
ncbi:MAG: GIY-YIG nuclease family protein [Bacteroidales bacterium]|jgi:putative endonuclease|nr:GIY-YIG nuclease family protein [Bacteroidales bacterium]